MSFRGFTPRAAAVALRTYSRPKSTGSGLENWNETIDRSMYDHHERLWVGAGGTPNLGELSELAALGRQRKSTVSGRTLWLGGTDYAYSRPCCQFNCSALSITSVYDLVDACWLLLNGSGVGFKPKSGTLHGYPRTVKLQIVPSDRPPDFKGPKENREILPTPDNEYTWTIKVGDSAEAWAKAVGKLFGEGSRNARTLVFDGSDCRGPGGRLKGYGWICNGFDPLAKAVSGIHRTLNEKAGQLLDEIDIMDVVNRIGEVLSSRRSAQMTIMDSSHPLEQQFARAKERYWEGNNHRRQSNNSELFWGKPSLDRIHALLVYADECGGDPGIINADGARRKCPWFELVNPCAEILLPSKGFCNLTTNCLPRFGRPGADLERAVWLVARANYRQTCVDLRDGVLQPGWHQANEALRLCGVSLTGIVQVDRFMTDYTIRRLRNAAIAGAYSMADELGLPRPKAITTVKPEGTGSKAMGGDDVGEIAEGMNRPMGRYVFNWVNFSHHDPVVAYARDAGYRVIQNPQDSNNLLVCWPVEYRGVDFQTSNQGVPVNLEPAVSQLERYLRWNNLWADHNVSSTISYSPHEIPEVADWVHRNWDRGYVATAFLRRVDPTMKPADVGQPYLPQEVVSGPEFEEYAKSLKSVDWDAVAERGVFDMPVGGGDCKNGECAVR